MYLVRTRLGKSDIEGIGLFAAEPIKKGSIVWTITEWDRRFDREDLDVLPDLARQLILCYGYYDTDNEYYVLDVDNGRFTNHSYTPNLIITAKGTEEEDLCAVRDIDAGEELTIDYRTFDGMVEKRELRLGTPYRDFLDNMPK